MRSLGWLQVEEEDLSPGRSSLAVSNVIQQLSHCREGPEQRDRLGAWGEVRMQPIEGMEGVLEPHPHLVCACRTGR